LRKELAKDNDEGNPFIGRNEFLSLNKTLILSKLDFFGSGKISVLPMLFEIHLKF